MIDSAEDTKVDQKGQVTTAMKMYSLWWETNLYQIITQI